MAKKIVDNLEGVPEEYHQFYSQTEDGKFELTEIEPLRNTVTHVKRERDEARRKAKAVEQWEKLGKTPEEIQELLAAREAEEEKRRKEAGDFDGILNQHKQNWETEKSKLLQDLESERAFADRAITQGPLAQALAAAGATEEGLDLLPDRLGSRVRVERVDGERKIRIMSPDGQGVLAGSGANGEATFNDLVAEAKKKWPSLFKGTGASGSGASNGSGSGADHRGLKRSAMSIEDKAKFIEQHGKTEYDRLPM